MSEFPKAQFKVGELVAITASIEGVGISPRTGRIVYFIRIGQTDKLVTLDQSELVDAEF